MKKHLSFLVFVLVAVSLIVSHYAFSDSNPDFSIVPTVGSVTVLSAGNPNDASRVGDLSKMGASDWVKIAVLGTDGLPYPLNFSGSKNGKPESMSVILEFYLEKSDGTLTNKVDAVLISLAKAEFWLPASAVRERNICETGSCPKDKNLLTNPLVPGSVYLKNIKAIGEFSSGASSVESQFSMRVKLFTIGSPANISADKSSAKEDETVTISGSNLDVFDAKTNRFSNSFIIDLDRNAITDDGDLSNYGRMVNLSLSKDAEDRVHYCGSTEIKLDMPGTRRQFTGGKLKDFQANFSELPKLSLGSHTLTFFNDFGYSNTIDIDLVSGKGTPEDDSSCQNPSATITSISPTSGPVGTEVTIKGTDFVVSRTGTGYGNFNWPKFNGITALDVTDFKYETYTGAGGHEARRGTEIKVKVPEGATTGPVSVIPGLGFSALGPVFMVTGEEAGEFSVYSISPSKINIDNDNMILIKGSRFSKPVLGSDNNAVQFSDIEVSDDGAQIRAKAIVKSTAAGTAKVTVTDGGKTDTAKLDLVVKDPASPEISSVEVSALEDSQVMVTFNGDNMREATLNIYGIEATVSDIQTTQTQLKATLSLAEDTSQKGVRSFLALLKNVVFAADPDTSEGVAEVCNTKGCDTAEVDASKAAAVEKITTEEEGKESKLTYSNFSFKIENPFKAKADNIFDVLELIAKFIYQLGVPVAVIIIIYSGITYLFAGGRPAVIQKATKGLVYSLLGLAIILIGRGFVSLIQSILGVK